MTNQERAESVVASWLVSRDMGHYTSARISELIVEALHNAGLLMPDDMSTEYGVWAKRQEYAEEIISWERDDDLSKMVINLRKSGWNAEKIARHVSPYRFTTLTEEPK